MSRVSFDNRVFIGVVNYDDGDFTTETLFHYHQHKEIVWATYEGGGVAFGILIGLYDATGNLDLRWRYVSTEGKVIAGKCRSRPEILPDGRVRLHERWRITEGGRQQGTSVIEEIREREQCDETDKGPPAEV